MHKGRPGGIPIKNEDGNMDNILRKVIFFLSQIKPGVMLYGSLSVLSFSIAAGIDKGTVATAFGIVYATLAWHGH